MFPKIRFLQLSFFKLFFLTLFFVVMAINSSSQNLSFSTFFFKKTLRLDFIHSGTSTAESYHPVRLKEEPYWGGPINHFVDTIDLGNYRISVYDSSGKTLIYRYGYSCLFYEWQRETEASNIERSFEETIHIPYPKQTIQITIEVRNKSAQWQKIWSYTVSPTNYLICHDRPFAPYKIDTLWYNGNVHKKVDLVFLAEGYTQSQMQKFYHDARRMIKALSKYEPFKSHMEDFNFWAVESISPDSGCDDPRKGIWKNTIFDSHFNTFNSDRYLTSSKIWKIHDVASVVPYDQIYVLVNTDKYGGGGVFNYFSLTSVDNASSEKVFVHEFGHAFAGLADEYFYTSEENQDYYPRNVEPWEPNITTLVDFSRKWQSSVPKSIPIPTPDTKKYRSVIGAFEGAGYCSKGVYRPMHSCIMKELKTSFCPVCQNAILRQIRHYCDEE